ncbi:MAG TPA: hypothetical protein VME18_10680 [Acidobacteriaceae bacterium]|nr:hypothetical protein [Acidobacteriaceae bacterium]
MVILSRPAFLLTLIGAVVTPQFACAQRFPASDPAVACSRANLEQSVTVDQLTFSSYHNEKEGTACFQAVRNGRILFRRTSDNDGDYLIGQRPNPRRCWNVPNISDGVDLTGLGHPDMVVCSYTGGAHCCLPAWVFELQPAFRRIAAIDAEDTWPAYFADVDHNGHYYFLSDDWTFAYWPNSFAGSPVAPIVLQFVPDGKGGGSYHLALEKMRKPAPTPAEWNKSLRHARAAFSNGPWPLFLGATLWTTEMRLIYSGHSDLAWKFLNEAWPAKIPGKQSWLGDFCSRLKTSPCWLDLQPSLRDTPAVCAAAKPKMQQTPFPARGYFR